MPMRLWSLHPCYLDPAGLVACWREGLLAQSVLSGATIGYRNHPQLLRFRMCDDPVVAVDTYLETILQEARRRGYNFDATKIGAANSALSIPLTRGQLAYELEHLRRKLQVRAPGACMLLPTPGYAEPHPLFAVADGEIENWEKI